MFFLFLIRLIILSKIFQSDILGALEHLKFCKTDVVALFGDL
jgi:hypothetical protein